MADHKLHLLALSLTKGLGPVSVKNMIAFCGSAKAVFHTPKGKLLRAPGIGEHTFSLLKREQALERAEEELNFCEKQGIEVLTYLDEAYPDALKYIYDAPLILFKKGNIDFNAQVNLAIVGTRQATERGIELTERFAKFFAQKACNIVSGLAFGIDMAAHRAVLKSGGRTTAVLAHGLHTIYPSQHRRKAAEICERGALLSEYLSGTEPDPPHFPARNRIVSGISKAVIVMEAAEKGGALITARFAFEQDRHVYAVPGRPEDRFSQGCNRLIRDNIAKLISDPADVLEDLDIKWQQHEEKSQQLKLALAAPPLALSKDEARILNFLAEGDAVIDKIAQHFQIPLAALNPLLLGMEFKDLLKQLPGKKYRKK